jgi:hypothetical protein
MSILIQPFAETINTIIRENKMTNCEFSEYLKKKGVNISEKRISEYRNYLNNIPYQKARGILIAFNISMDENELFQALEENGRIVKTNDYAKMKYLRSGISINLEKLLEGQPASVTRYILEDRIRDLYGNEKRNLSIYITQLIKKDLEAFILEKENK